MQAPLNFAHFEVLTRSDGSPLVLGRGGMGVTYKALDRNLLAWAVVKVMTGSHEGRPEARQRFLQEARLMARMRHPHVASVFYFGESDEGAFYAMEFCEGFTLQQFVEREGVMQWKEAFRMGLQVASALQALEALELVHRDLKPSNIILTRDSSGATQIKLIDFGIAREGPSIEGFGLTQGSFLGTPVYASPEQLLDSGRIDARSDLYSLGAVLWFCLTGSPPFVGSPFEIMFHHANSEPDWTALGELPREALLIMKRLLGKSAHERPDNPGVLCAELHKLLGEYSSAPLVLSMAVTEEEDDQLYELIEERPADGFGQMWRARDFLTGQVVALRRMPPQFNARQGLVLRAQRLVACVRNLEHPHWQRALHFEQSGPRCYLATEWIEGPTLLTLLKARQALPLVEALPFLAQAAQAMDFAAANSLSTMEIAVERVRLEVVGWDAMSEEAKAQWMRQPAEEKSGGWRLKMCPVRMGLSPHDLVLPTDAEASQAAARMAQDFVQLCFRLLTGQGRESTGYVPSSQLKAGGNTFFEKRMGANAAAIGVSTCQHQLSLLCLAEGVPMGDWLGGDDEGMATRVAGSLNTLSGAPTMMRGGAETTLTGGQSTRVVTKGRAGATAGRSGGPTGGSMGTKASARLRELEERRRQLEAEAEQLQAEGKLEAEREWLAREKEGLEEARARIAAQEAERKQRLSQEQKVLDEQRQAVEQQQVLLEQKRQEQQRLEQELQARAQLDFQKLQEEARAREADWQRQREEAEQALKSRESEFLSRERESLAKLEMLKQEAARLEQQRTVELQHGLLKQTREEQERVEQEIRQRAEEGQQKRQEEERQRSEQWKQQRAEVEENLRRREAEFLAREQESIARLEALKKESTSLEQRVQENARALHQSQLEQNRRQQEVREDAGVAQRTFKAEEIRLDELRRDLDERLEQARKTHRKRVRLLVLGSIAAIVIAGVVAFFVKGQIKIKDFSKLGGHEQWEGALAERANAKTEKKWDQLLNWTVLTSDALRARPDYAPTLAQHEKELTDDAALAVQSLLQEPNKIPDPKTEPGRKLLQSLEKTKDWGLPPERLLLIAKLRMPEAVARGDGVEAMQAYLEAVHANAAFATQLKPDLDNAVHRLSELLHSGEAMESISLEPLLEDVARTQPDAEGGETFRFRRELMANVAKRQGKPKEALRLLVDMVQLHPAWAESVKAQATQIMTDVLKLPAPELLDLKAELRVAADAWKLPETYLFLSDLEADPKAKFDDLQMADGFGSMQARALVGRALLDEGVATRRPELAQQGAAKLREAASSGNSQAMVLLGEALCFGRGIAEDDQEALQLALKAEKLGDEDAPFLEARARVHLGESTNDPAQYTRAIELLEKAVEKNMRGASYFLYRAYNSKTVNNPERALAALEKGAVGHDPTCLYTLGLWSIVGQAPLQAANETRGRTLIEEAASLGHPKAKEWLAQHPK